MPRRGECIVEPGYQYQPDEQLDLDKQNQAAQPSVRVAEHAIGAAELVEEDIEEMATGANAWAGREVVLDRKLGPPADTRGVLRSSDFEPGIFYDGVLVVGSTAFSSNSAQFTTDDNNRLVVGIGIQPGTYATFVNANTVTLSLPALLQYIDGVITGGTNFQSSTAIFSPSDNGRVIVDTAGLIPVGTTLTYVDPTHATLSQAATADGTGVIFQINGRQQAATQFVLSGRGRGWQAQVDANGIGRLEYYAGVNGAQIVVGSFVVNPDGSISHGYGAAKLTATLAGDFTWGTGANAATLTHDGKFYIGATTFLDALAKFDKNGNFSLIDIATAMHSIDLGAVSSAIADVIASPAGGAIVNPTAVSLNCLSKFTKIYYRLNAADGVTNGTTTFTSATGNFAKWDIGKIITGQDIPAGTRIADVTNLTTIILSAAATGSHTGIDYQVTPDINDTLYTDGTPITLTVSRRMTARAYHGGHYSALGTWLFDTAAGATTVQNPFTDPVAGSYSGSSLAVTLKDNTVLSSIFYNKTHQSTGTPADPADPTHDGGLNPTGGTTKVALDTVLTFSAGKTKIKLLAAKAGLTDSAIVPLLFTVTTASNTGGGGLGGGGGGGKSNV